MSQVTHRVAVRPRAQPDPLSAPAGYALPYLPGGCPADFATWPARDGRYPGPHLATVCPTCLPTHRQHADVSAPFPVPPHHPMISFAGPTSTPPHRHDTAGGNPDLLHLLTSAGFVRAGWLPLPGFDEPFVADHPADHSRAILDIDGIQLYLHEPDTGRPFHVHAGPRVNLAVVHAALTCAGHSTPAIATPPLPPSAQLLTPDTAAHLITTGAHTHGQHGDLAIDLGLIDALRNGAILAVRLPDGTLAFTPAPHHPFST
ncbi:hypothetical protein MXD61_05190 [Frankia sp. AgPm24]|uniref:hypothetical protein n=1 Tax=Frankia sp. AgPm24 TaxID=631128 RepID=UPI0020101E2E|nr:hypothetical protein [Frankia sp. AgPm24]MCK9921301.1 hypothetical protein [Frankia sp. AgPm24]